MLEALALRWASRRVRGAVVVACSALLLAFCGLAAAGADINVESLQISIVEGPSTIVDRASLGLDKAVVGDTVRVSALVWNQGAEAVGEFEVDFFFTETISGEHGRLGTQVVSGLESGESKRPIIVFDTSSLSPGIYAFSAEADPRGALAEDDLCDNRAPRGACGGEASEDASKYSLTLLREGRHISQLRLQTPFPVCRMGKLESDLTVTVYNVGTEALSGSDLVVYGYYRLALNPPDNKFDPLVADAAGKPAPLPKTVSSLGQPGARGSINITLSYDEFSVQFAPGSEEGEQGEVLGRADAAQIRITVQPADGSGTAQDLFLPEQFELSDFYSTVDLWTFPERDSCCTGDCTAAVFAPVVPAVAGGLVFHAAIGADGYALHVLQPKTGEDKATWPAPAGQTLTAPVAAYDENSDAYRVYIGASDGRIYALEGTQEEEGFSLVDLWQSPAADTIVKGDTHLVVSADRTKLIAGSESGAFVLDTSNGQVLRRTTNHGAVTSSPAYVDATGALWMAADETLCGVLASGTECIQDLQDPITTDLLLNEQGTALFVGTESGFLYAIDASVTGTACTEIDELDPLRSIVGMTSVTEGADAVLFLASDIGEMARVEYDGRGFQDVTLSARRLYPSAIAVAPAALRDASGDDAAAVFVVGTVREGRATRPILAAWDRDLEVYGDVTVWGKQVPLLFKPEEGGKAPSSLLRPVVEPEWEVLLVLSSDGILYAFDVSNLK